MAMHCDYCGFMRGGKYKCLSCGAPPTSAPQAFLVRQDALEAVADLANLSPGAIIRFDESIYGLACMQPMMHARIALD